MSILKSVDDNKVRVCIEAVCHDCKHRHKINVLPDNFGQAAFDWEYKHRNHHFEFLSANRFLPKGFDDSIFERAGRAPWWLDYKHNADLKIAYVADAAFTIDLSALAASSTLVAGRESTSISNTSNNYIDYRISGSFISGTTPTAGGEARLSYVAPIEDAPTWPDVFDGTDSAETITNTAIRDKLPIGWSGDYSTTTNVTYPIVGALTIAQAFGICPSHFLLFFSHSMTAALKTDSANTNSIYYKGIYFTSI
jgi:hypothetical protein